VIINNSELTSEISGPTLRMWSTLDGSVILILLFGTAKHPDFYSNKGIEDLCIKSLRYMT
jgi:hypothetical protein